MKAKFVYENMRFERGTDPKYSMDIGMSIILKEKIEDLENDTDVGSHGRHVNKISLKTIDEENLYMKVPYSILYGWNRVDKAVKRHLGEELFNWPAKDAENIGYRLYFIKPEYQNLFKAAFDINEAMNFERGIDPKRSMNIGRKTQILKDLEEAQISPDDVEILPDFVILGKNVLYNNRDALHQIQMKYMPEKKRELVSIIMHDSPMETVEYAIEEALKNGISKEDIEVLIKEFAHGKQSDQATIYLTKHTRTQEEIEHDEENNIYVFIGYTKKVPVEVNGKKYYEDKFSVENMVKIDKFSTANLSMVNVMKMRFRYQGYEDGGVYMLEIPKEFMDEDSYHEIPEHLQDIVEEYKRRI